MPSKNTTLTLDPKTKKIIGVIVLPAIATKEELQEKIIDYFRSCHLDGDENQKITRPYTMSGLALHLKLSRRVLLRYAKEENRKDFHDIMAWAKTRIESFTEEQLFTNKNVSGVSLVLKNNFGWKDSSELLDDETKEADISQVKDEMNEEDAQKLYLDVINGTYEEEVK